MKQKHKAVFLDRDGVINREKGHYIYQVNDFEFNEDVFVALKKLFDAGFLLIVISNQGGIAKNLYSIADVDDLHRWMRVQFEKVGIEITDIYYCPHHPEKTKCLCRKPDSLMLERAIVKYNIDVKTSYLIGDQERDILAAQKVGVTGVKIQSNQNLLPVVQAILTK